MRWPGPSLQRRLAAALMAALLASWLVDRAVANAINYVIQSRDFSLSACYGFHVPVLPPPGNCAPYTPATSWVALAAVVVIVLPAVVAASWVVAGRLLAPLTETAETVRQLGPQNLGQRIRRGGSPDALRELADAIDDALDRLASGYESQRRFTANASHELRTQLAVQRLLTEVAMDDPASGPDLHRLGGQLLRASQGNEKLIEGLLALAESERGLLGKVPVRLDELTASVLDAHAGLAAERGVSLRPVLAERLVPGDPLLLERLISNLVTNAIMYNQPDGWVEVTVSAQPDLTVRNTGQDIPAAVLPSLFEPFRRLAADRTDHRGAGLGLSIVRAITVAHDGAVHAQPRDGGGLIVEIELPPTS